MPADVDLYVYDEREETPGTTIEDRCRAFTSWLITLFSEAHALGKRVEYLHVGPKARRYVQELPDFYPNINKDNDDQCQGTLWGAWVYFDGNEIPLAVRLEEAQDE